MFDVFFGHMVAQTELLPLKSQSRTIAAISKCWRSKGKEGCEAVKQVAALILRAQKKYL